MWHHVKNNDVQLQNSNLKFGIMSISYMKSNFREKQHINGQDPAEQVYKIFMSYWVIMFLVLGHFLSRTL